MTWCIRSSAPQALINISAICNCNNVSGFVQKDSKHNLPRPMDTLLYYWKVDFLKKIQQEDSMLNHKNHIYYMLLWLNPSLMEWRKQNALGIPHISFIFTIEFQGTYRVAQPCDFTPRSHIIISSLVSSKLGLVLPMSHTSHLPAPHPTVAFGCNIKLHLHRMLVNSLGSKGGQPSCQVSPLPVGLRNFGW